MSTVEITASALIDVVGSVGFNNLPYTTRKSLIESAIALRESQMRRYYISVSEGLLSLTEEDERNLAELSRLNLVLER